MSEFRLQWRESSNCARKTSNSRRSLQKREKRYADAAAQVKQLNAERQQHENERNDVRSRIEKILTRFDGIDLG